MINSDSEISDSEIICTGIPCTKLQNLMIELASRYCVPVGGPSGLDAAAAPPARARARQHPGGAAPGMHL